MTNTTRIKPKKQSGTGRALEKSVIPALEQGGYEFEEQDIIGLRITGGVHRIDIVAWKPNGSASILVSLKWQQVSGTAEQKVPYEVICLRDAVLKGRGYVSRAYLVLGGTAWTMRDFFISDEFERYLPHRDTVTILTLEEFMAIANTGQL